MAEWLLQVMEEVNRQYEELPEWKRTSAEQLLNFSSDESEDQESTSRYSEGTELGQALKC